jgi:NTF2 fold immunity protein
MKTCLLGIVLFVSGVLSLRMISASPLQTPAQRASQQPMDKWVALDWSLKNAKPAYKTIHPKNGFVPDESTAVKIGEAAAIAQYGEKQISGERPFEARLRGGIWTVVGTLHPQGAYGGTAVIQLSKADGRIVFMTHQY